MSNEYRDDHRDGYRSGRGGNPNRGGNSHGGHGGHSGNGGHGERRGIPLSDLDPTTTEASRKVIGCSIEVHRQLGPGYEPAVYLAALRHELDAAGVKHVVNHKVPVLYKNAPVGEIETCLFIEGLFLVCVFATPGQVTPAQRLSLRAQLRAASLDLGLIINFAERRLKDGLVRVLNVEKINAERGVLHDGTDEEEGHHGADPDFDSHA